jgi:hypothetical protein
MGFWAVDAKLRLPCALASGDAADDMLGEMPIGAESLGEERVAAAFKRARNEDVVAMRAWVRDERGSDVMMWGRCMPQRTRHAVHAWRYHATQRECSSRIGCLACCRTGRRRAAAGIGCSGCTSCTHANGRLRLRVGCSSWGGAASLDAAAAQSQSCIHVTVGQTRPPPCGTRKGRPWTKDLSSRCLRSREMCVTLPQADFSLVS